MRFSMISIVSQTRTTSRVALASAWEGVSSAAFGERRQFGRGEFVAPASPGAFISVMRSASRKTRPASGMPMSTSSDVEGDMRVDELVGHGGAEQAERRLKPDDRDQRDERAGAAHDEVAERHDAGLGRRCARQHDGDDAAADIGAEHQHDAEFDRHEAARGKRHDQQDRRDAGMEEPGHDRGEQEGRDRIARQVVHDDRQDLALAQRLGGFADHAAATG